MYSRDYGGQSLNFEASGGLTHASIILRDKQTSSFWSLMKGNAEMGEYKGEELKVLPLGEKMYWKEWKARYPNTKVFSFKNRQDAEPEYVSYFKGKTGYRGAFATDERLQTMSPIFAFRLDGASVDDSAGFEIQKDETAGKETPEKETPEDETPDETSNDSGTYYAAAYDEFESGLAIPLEGGGQIFLYRHKDDEMFRSTTALISEKGFEKSGEKWTELESGTEFDPEKRTFGAELDRVGGFDTFWYNWSLNNPNTKLLTGKKTDSNP